jgi:RNA polymerase sigma factor (sigma-70 family)
MPGAARLPGVRLRRRGGGDVPDSRAAEPSPPTATFDAHEPHAADGALTDAAAAAGDAAWTPPSWEQVVQEHSARVYRLAYRLTGNRHDAEDLTQEVFVRVFRSLSSYTPGTFEGWLHRITTNLFLDQVRRKQRIRFDALPEDAGDRLAGSDPGPERAWEHNNLDHDVQAALDTLPPEFRAAVVLCDIEGLSYEEIAATLDVKLGTVRSRIHRGRAALRQALAHRRPETGGTIGRDDPAVVSGGESGL